MYKDQLAYTVVLSIFLGNRPRETIVVGLTGIIEKGCGPVELGETGVRP
jgi:hypothetical protein